MDYMINGLRAASSTLTSEFLEDNLEKTASATVIGAILGGLAGGASQYSRLRKLQAMAPAARKGIMDAAEAAARKQSLDPKYILSPAEAQAKREAEILRSAAKATPPKVPAPTLSFGDGAPSRAPLMERASMGIAGFRRRNPVVEAGASDIASKALQGALAGGAAGKGFSALRKRHIQNQWKTIGKNVALPAAAGVGAGYLMSR